MDRAPVPTLAHFRQEPVSLGNWKIGLPHTVVSVRTAT
jgi:hypothetical protein